MRELSWPAWRSYFTGNDAITFQSSKKAVLSLLRTDKKATQERLKTWVKPLALAAFAAAGVATVYCGRSYLSTWSVSPISTDPVIPTDPSFNPNATSQLSQPTHSPGDPTPPDASLVPTAFPEEMGPYFESSLGGDQGYLKSAAFLSIAAAISVLICGRRCCCKKQSSTDESICRRICSTDASEGQDDARPLETSPTSDSEHKSSKDSGLSRVSSIVLETIPKEIVENPKLKGHLLALANEEKPSFSVAFKYATECFGTNAERSFRAVSASRGQLSDYSPSVLNHFHRTCKLTISKKQEEYNELIGLLSKTEGFLKNDLYNPTVKQLRHIHQWMARMLEKMKEECVEETKERPSTDSARINPLLLDTMPEEIKKDGRLKCLLLDWAKERTRSKNAHYAQQCFGDKADRSCAGVLTDSSDFVLDLFHQTCKLTDSPDQIECKSVKKNVTVTIQNLQNVSFNPTITKFLDILQWTENMLAKMEEEFKKGREKISQLYKSSIKSLILDEMPQEIWQNPEWKPLLIFIQDVTATKKVQNIDDYITRCADACIGPKSFRRVVTDSSTIDIGEHLLQLLFQGCLLIDVGSSKEILDWSRALSAAQQLMKLSNSALGNKINPILSWSCNILEKLLEATNSGQNRPPSILVNSP